LWLLGHDLLDGAPTEAAMMIARFLKTA